MKKAYDAVLYGMAYAAGLLMAAMMVVITLDVVLRNLGYQSSAHFFTSGAADPLRSQEPSRPSDRLPCCRQEL